MGLIGEMRKVHGRVSFGGRVAYCAQTAWIQNATLVRLLPEFVDFVRSVLTASFVNKAGKHLVWSAV